MELAFRRVDTLPRLSWCAVVEKDKDITEVFHGPWVETRESFFVEGGWENEFELGRFDEADAFMGTGGRIERGSVIFSTPTHVLERLYTIRIDNKFFVSPSMVFLLKMSGQSLDFNYIPYQVDLLNMVVGMEYHITGIPVQGGNRIIIYQYRNLVVGDNLEIEIQMKKEPPVFDSFNEYKGFLIDKLSGLTQNAASIRRKIRYSLISMLSSGYDSPACTALGTEVGLKEAVSFKTAREEKGVRENTEDSGKKIGEILGLEVKEYDRMEVLKKEGTPEAEFVASADLGQDFEISTFENDLQRKMVLVGYHGDIVWNVNAREAKKDICRHESGGGGWIDYKFRVGYIFVPLPFIGCLSHPSILRISKSKEMEPWRLGNNYDRPIARRLVEEKGVPRKLFGLNKKAISVLLNTYKSMLERMNPQSAYLFENFYQTFKNKRKAGKQLSYNFMYGLYRIYYKLFSRPNRALEKFGIPINIPCPIPKKFTQCPGRPSFLVHWGISVIERRYETDKS